MEQNREDIDQLRRDVEEIRADIKQIRDEAALARTEGRAHILDAIDIPLTMHVNDLGHFVRGRRSSERKTVLPLAIIPAADKVEVDFTCDHALFKFDKEGHFDLQAYKLVNGDLVSQPTSLIVLDSKTVAHTSPNSDMGKITFHLDQTQVTTGTYFIVCAVTALLPKDDQGKSHAGIKSTIVRFDK